MPMILEKDECTVVEGTILNFHDKISTFVYHFPIPNPLNSFKYKFLKGSSSSLLSSLSSTMATATGNLFSASSFSS